MPVIVAENIPLQPRKVHFPNEFSLLLLLVFPLVFCCVYVDDQLPSQKPRSFFAGYARTQKQVQQDSLTNITVSFTGDLMCHSPQYAAALQPDGSYDFSEAFAQVKPYFDSTDFLIGNLETTLAGAKTGYSGYPRFNSPDSFAAAIKAAGFTMLGTANNHSMDTGEEGLQRTLDVLDKIGIAHTGTFRSQHDRDSVRIVNVKGVKIGVLNYTYGTNGAYPSADHAYMLNVADSALVAHDVKLARAQGAEIVMVFYHWGLEYHPEPIPKQDSMMLYTVAAGADIIVGSHPHVIGPVNYFKTKNAKLDSGLVMWSMGNFISNQSQRYTDAGLLLNIHITKDCTKDSAWISKTTFVPTWVYRAYDDSNKNYVVVPAAWCSRDSLSVPAWISSASKQKMCEVVSDTKKIVTKYSAKPVMK